jgi:hypothetical protein
MALSLQAWQAPAAQPEPMRAQLNLNRSTRLFCDFALWSAKSKMHMNFQL